MKKSDSNLLYFIESLYSNSIVEEAVLSVYQYISALIQVHYSFTSLSHHL